MEAKLDNSKDQSEKKPVLRVEQAVAEPIVVGKAKQEVEPEVELDDDEMELEDDADDSETDDEPKADMEDSVADEVELEEEDEEPEPVKRLSKEQRKIKALKDEANRHNVEIAELKKQLELKKDSGKEDEIAKQYIDDGEDEQTARRKARNDIKQANFEKQVEILLFEKTNRQTLSKYPQADNDLEKIISASKTGVMTVEQICRGLYGSEMSAKDKRAIDALMDDGKATVNNTVAKSIRSAASPVKSKLTSEQLEIKKYLQNKFHRKITDDEAILYSES